MYVCITGNLQIALSLDTILLFLTTVMVYHEKTQHSNFAYIATINVAYQYQNLLIDCIYITVSDLITNLCV